MATGERVANSSLQVDSNVKFAGRPMS